MGKSWKIYGKMQHQWSLFIGTYGEKKTGFGWTMVVLPIKWCTCKNVGFTLHPPKKNNSNHPEMIVFAGLISGFPKLVGDIPCCHPGGNFACSTWKITISKRFSTWWTLLLSRAVISDNRNGKPTIFIHRPLSFLTRRCSLSDFNMF